MKLAVCGSRSITDKDMVFYHLDKYTGMDDPSNDFPITILSGGAKGVDGLAKAWADANGFDHVLFKPYHLVDTKAEYRTRFFFARNKQIIDNADKVLIIWDGKSNGTKWCIDYCKANKKSNDYLVVTLDETTATLAA